MLRKTALGLAAAAVLATGSAALAAHGGGGGGHGFGGGGGFGGAGGFGGHAGTFNAGHAFGGSSAMHSYAGPATHAYGRAGAGPRVGYGASMWGARRGFDHHGMHHHRHHLHGPGFAFFGDDGDWDYGYYGSDSCWVLVPTRWGWQRIWVCD
jgi:hypothetical protein